MAWRIQELKTPLQPHVGVAVGLLLVCLGTTGCYQNGKLAAGPGPWQSGAAPVDARLVEAERKARLLDDNNRQLHTQLAQAEQRIQVQKEELSLVREQLSVVAGQLQDAQAVAANTQKQFAGLKASTQFRGGASIEANSGLKRMADSLKLGSIPVEYDGDVVRIRLSSDQLFHARTAQLQPQANEMLEAVASAIANTFPRQKIGIEGYTDNAPLYGGAFGSNHQLAAAQAMAVFDHLTRRSGVPAPQLFVMAQGSNYPRADNTSAAGRAENRRIELVVYPETY